MMALGAGVIVPNVLRWYWWRLNGWGYTMGMLSGMLLAVVALFYPDIPVYVLFPLIVTVSFVACVAASYMTVPCDAVTLMGFYTSVRPFGFWRPVRDMLPSTDRLPANDLTESAALALLNVLLGMIGVSCAYLAPMYFVGHWYGRALTCLVFGGLACQTLYFTWYRTLPPPCDQTGIDVR